MQKLLPTKFILNNIPFISANLWYQASNVPEKVLKSDLLSSKHFSDAAIENEGDDAVGDVPVNQSLSHADNNIYYEPC